MNEGKISTHQEAASQGASEEELKMAFQGVAESGDLRSPGRVRVKVEP